MNSIYLVTDRDLPHPWLSYASEGGYGVETLDPGQLVLALQAAFAELPVLVLFDLANVSEAVALADKVGEVTDGQPTQRWLLYRNTTGLESQLFCFDDFLPAELTQAVVQRKLALAHSWAYSQRIAAAEPCACGVGDTLANFFKRLVAQRLNPLAGVRYCFAGEAALQGAVLLSRVGAHGNRYFAAGRLITKAIDPSVAVMPLVSLFDQLTDQDLAVGQIAAALNRSVDELYQGSVQCALSIVEYNPSRKECMVWSGDAPDFLVFDRHGAVKARVAARHPALPQEAGGEFNQSVDHIELAPGDYFIQRVPFPADQGGQWEGWLESCNQVEEPIDTLSAWMENNWPDSESSRAFLQFDVTACEPDLVSEDVCVDDSSEQPPTTLPWELSVHLGPDELKSINPTQQIVKLLANASGLNVHQDYISTILTELYSNSLEHGVLKLDSELKADDEGFIEYYSQRALRLSSLDSGWVTISIKFDDPHVTLRVHDSGDGFDYVAKQSADHHSEDDCFGRGTNIVAALCESVSYSHNGSCIEAVYEIVR